MERQALQRKTVLPLWFLVASVGALLVFFALRTTESGQLGQQQAESLAAEVSNLVAEHYQRRLPASAPIDVPPYYFSQDNQFGVNETVDDNYDPFARFFLSSSCQAPLKNHLSLATAAMAFFRSECGGRPPKCNGNEVLNINSQFWPRADVAATSLSNLFPDHGQKGRAQYPQVVGATFCLLPVDAAAPSPMALRIYSLVAYEVAGQLAFHKHIQELSQ